jgi:hypothetical protein
MLNNNAKSPVRFASRKKSKGFSDEEYQVDNDPLNIGSEKYGMNREQHEILKQIKKSCFRLKILNEVSFGNEFCSKAKQTSV